MINKRSALHSYVNIFHYTGLILLFSAITILTPLISIIFFPQETVNITGFILPAIGMALLGAMCWFFIKPECREPMDLQQSQLVVVFSWIIVCIFSTIPFIIIEKMSFFHALFESVSGWTTTGLTLINVEHSSRLILLWRSIMQLAGGAGLAIIMLATILGPQAPTLSVAEGRSVQLVPQVRSSAKLVLVIYGSYILVGITAYVLAGMGIFDAVNHTFTAISTGGFSTKSASIGYWNSLPIDAVTIVLMMLGSLNFLTVYLLFHGKFKTLIHNSEVKIMAVLIPVSIFLFYFLVGQKIYPVVAERIRITIFQIISALTTTGFTSTTYAHWTSFAFFITIILMLIGGGTCSTAGGIKQYRIYVLIKSAIWEIKKMFLPQNAVIENYIWQGERKDFIQHNQIRRISLFFFLYITVFVIGSGIICAHGYNVKDSLFEFTSALGTVGLSVGITSTQAPPLVLGVEIAGMFLGRLEFIVIFVTIIKIVRDIIGKR
ncbi:MAG: TrkH family potassium uptake protein [Candidatus Cloacimonetes bacterium]|nr:TrkH family potassium uptake protein [Candidatus Cloacimonadota bacterium]